MDPERWRRIEQLYESVLQRPEAERIQFLQNACAGDDELRREVSSLIAQETAAADFMEAPAMKIVRGGTPLGEERPTQPPKNISDISDLSGRTLSHYQIVKKLGSGGMGVVYAAEDVRLGRVVALKLLLEPFRRDQVAVERLRREARTASSLNHPNICTIFDIGEQDGALFIVMELLEGTSLATRVRSGPMPTDEATAVCTGLLAALDALHSRGLVHRDVKPSNVFLTKHGPKLLDFGLTKSVGISADHNVPLHGNLTQSGLVVGTPQYMSPEQLQSGEVDARSDLFSMGAVLFEMVCGHAAFGGRTIPEVFHRIVFDSPAPLAGAAAPLQAIVARALAKRPADRFQTASAMASQLHSLGSTAPTHVAAPAANPTRLIVLPFLQPRSDPDTAFLCFSLPDAISSSLAGLRSPVVRSSRIASRYSGVDIDLRAITEEAGVDAVLTGTLLRSGDQIRASVQLMEAPSGTLVWTDTTHVRLEDVFQLQDSLVKGIVESLAVPLTDRERSLMSRDIPANARGYEYFLRANHLSSRLQDLTLARELYLRSLDEDPRYAPAWARLARCYRVRAKYGDNPDKNTQLAAEAFERAFALNPELPAAHSLYAQHEAEQGHADQALVRLLNSGDRNPNDPELYSGLVYVCRYAGLLEASLAAHDRAQRLDPNVRTTVMNTHFVMGNFRLVVDAGADEVGYVAAMALDALGHRDQARERLQRADQLELPPLIRRVIDMLKHLFAGERRRAVECLRELNLEGVDPEGYFYRARLLAQLGETDEALGALDQAVRKGFWCVPALLKDTFLEPVRSLPAFPGLLTEAEARAGRAARAFVDAGGQRVLSSS
jgi:eukaryotic-like serine/threonine-protein kinase